MTILKTLSAVTLLGSVLATTSGCVIHEHDHGRDHGRYCAVPAPREVEVYRPAPVVVHRDYDYHGGGGSYGRPYYVRGDRCD